MTARKRDKDRIRNRQTDPYIEIVVGYMARTGAKLTADQIIDRVGLPASGAPPLGKIIAACRFGNLAADKSGAVTRYQATGVPYGLDQPAPKFAGLDVLGYGRRVASVFDLGAQA